MIRYFHWLGLFLCCLGSSLRADDGALNPGTIHSLGKLDSKGRATISHADIDTTAAAPTPAPAAALSKVDSKVVTAKTSLRHQVASAVRAAKSRVIAVSKGLGGRLARITAYWAGEGDYYTGRCLSATGIRLHGGHCAVDPRIIPYGSVVEIPGVGQFLAVDTGSAVISRTAAREAGHTKEERSALVIDVFFEHRSQGEKFASTGTRFIPISWWTPTATDQLAKEARSVFADEDWNKIYSKQL